MDLDQLLDSLDKNGSFGDASDTSSDVKAAEQKDPQVSSTSEDVGESKSTGTVASEDVDVNDSVGGDCDGKEGTSDDVAEGDEVGQEGDQSAPETGGKPHGKGNGDRKNDGGHRKARNKGFSRLDMAEYKAEKWKRKAKDAIAAKNELAAEFEKYKDLNPRAFDNDEDRMEFLAWKASTAQKLNDMESEIDSMEEEGERERFNAKVADCYNEEGAAQFERLDDHYRDAFSYMCDRVDPENVIVDFLAGSRWEAPMREVIYKNGKLQEDLFRQFRNPAIAASKRLAILEALERQVEDFFTGSRLVPAGRNGNPSASGRAAAPVNNTQNQNHTRTQYKPGTRPRFVLPSMENRSQQGTQAANKQLARKATGSLVRGSEPTSQMDVSAQADALWKELRKTGV